MRRVTALVTYHEYSALALRDDYVAERDKWPQKISIMPKFAC